MTFFGVRLSAFSVLLLQRARLTVGVTCAGAGLDSLYEQDSAERGKRLKMPQNPQRQVHALLAAFLGMKYS